MIDQHQHQVVYQSHRCGTSKIEGIDSVSLSCMPDMVRRMSDDLQGMRHFHVLQALTYQTLLQSKVLLLILLSRNAHYHARMLSDCYT